MNSNETTSPPTPPTPSDSPSPAQLSLSEVEKPVLALPPGSGELSPGKPIKDMTDEELSTWHANLRDFQTHQTLVAHLREGNKETKAKGPKEPEGINPNEYA